MKYERPNLKDFEMKYETPADKEREEFILQVATKQWGLEAQKLSAVNYKVDYVFHTKGVIQCFVEIKDRTASGKLSSFSTVYIGLAKVLAGTLLARHTGVEFVFIVKFEDGIFFHTFKDEDSFPVRVKGSYYEQRCDFDIEPIVEIPVERFNLLEAF